jgi:hypothetical protein
MRTAQHIMSIAIRKKRNKRRMSGFSFLKCENLELASESAENWEKCPCAAQGASMSFPQALRTPVAREEGIHTKANPVPGPTKHIRRLEINLDALRRAPHGC